VSGDAAVEGSPRRQVLVAGVAAAAAFVSRPTQAACELLFFSSITVRMILPLVN
jgi:hypothetical protein